MSRNDDKNNGTEENNVKGMDRREFIKRTAVGAGAVAVTMVTGCGGNSSTSSVPAVALAAPVGPSSTTAWKFGVMADTQWLDSDDGRNPNTSAIDIINQLNTQFIAQGVKFVVQVGDLADKATAGASGYDVPLAGGSPYHLANGQVAEDTRALFTQPLYNAGIGFFTVRGNHDDTAATAAEFLAAFPQTVNGRQNASPAKVLSVNNPDAANQPSPTASGSSFTIGSNFSSIGSPSTNLAGLSYGFDYNNARFLFIDQFTPLDGKDPDGATYSVNTTVKKQLTWVDTSLAGKPANGHAFVFAHKGLMTQQHIDVLFGTNPSTAASPGMDDFIRSMYNRGAKLYFCGHDHIHNRSLIKTIDGGAAGQVTHVLCASNSSKFYGPNEYNAAGNGTVATGGCAPLTSNDAQFCGGNRQTQLSQELNTVGYYIVTVDGATTTVDYYSAPVAPVPDTANLGKEFKITTTPTLNFSKRETFGYGVNGKQFLIAQGASFTAVSDTSPAGTVAKVLAGTNGYSVIDASGRKYSVAVNTGWLSAAGPASDILLLTGMAYNLGSPLTDVYALSMSYDKTKAVDSQIQSGNFALATQDGNGYWCNAADQTFGGYKKFVLGPWKSDYKLGTYGVDTTTNTVWAVLNYNGYFAACSVL
jgi:hypothetical protein